VHDVAAALAAEGLQAGALGWAAMSRNVLNA
jgi:hypothetical protein